MHARWCVCPVTCMRYAPSPTHEIVTDLKWAHFAPVVALRTARPVLPLCCDVCPRHAAPARAIRHGASQVGRLALQAPAALRMVAGYPVPC